MSFQDQFFDSVCHTIRDAVHELIRDDSEASKRIADHVVFKLKKYYGTQRIYIPAESNHERDEKIRREFNGRNHKEVCKNNGISERTLYRIIGG